MRTMRIVSALASMFLACFQARAEAQYASTPTPSRVYRYAPARPLRPAPVAPGTYGRWPRRVAVPNRTGYVNRPYYGAYGYGNYSNGSTDGFPPFQARRPR